MNSKTVRLLLYSDSPDFGGHEVMTLRILEHLLETGEFTISFIYSPRNGRLEGELTAIQSRFLELVLRPSSYTSGRLQMLRTPVAIGALRRIRELMRRFRPDCVIAIQGEIGLSSLGVLAGIREGVLTISYIPAAHTRRQRGDSRFPRLKDMILSLYYRLPSRYITISEKMGMMLRERGARQPIDVVENGVDPSVFQRIDKRLAREHLGLPQADFLTALCGRIEFKQKGFDVLLRALEGRMREFNEWTFLVVGDGPDRQQLQATIEKLNLAHKVKILAWQQSMSLIYSSVDLVVIPSKYEGVPAVMLEAMYYGLPIVGSAVDAMAELLPGEWLFPVGDSDALADAMLRVRSMDNDRFLERNKHVVATRFTVERQKREFARVLFQCTEQVAKSKSEDRGKVDTILPGN